MDTPGGFYDVIVVGSGAAGSWAAKDLTEGGLRVLLLEAGPRRDSDRDFNADASRAGWGRGKRALAALQGQNVQVRCALMSDATRNFFVNDRQNRYSTPRGEPFYWIRGRQLGGRLHTWARHAPRMSEFEFKAASLRGEGMDWPISYDDVAPHYDRVEKTLGLYGKRDDIPSCPDGQYVGPGPITQCENTFRENVHERMPNVRVGHGRYLKYDAGPTPLPIRLALETGGLEIRTDAIATRLVIDPETGMADGVEYVDRLTRAASVARGRVVVLCASAIETVRLLLNSKCARHPHGVGGSAGLLGRYFGDHVKLILHGPLAKEKNLEARPAEGHYDFGGAGLYIPSFPETEDRDFHARYGIQIAIGAVWPGWFMTAFGEMEPRYDNQVSIDPKRKDAWGIPAARIRCSHSANDIRLGTHMKRMLSEIARAGQLDLYESPPPWAASLERQCTRHGAAWPGLSIHEMGGARMGSDPKDSVLNSYGQCWDAANVFVTDGACFVYPGYQNPTLTIMALTSRACQNIIAGFSDIGV